MKVRKHKMWPLILFAIIITLFTTLLGVEYIAAVTIDNYQKENEDFDQSLNNVSTLISNDLNKYKDSLHTFSLFLSNAYKDGQQIPIDTLLHTMKMTNQFDDLHIISQNNVSSRVADGIILQTMDSLVFYSYIANTASYLYGTIAMTRVYEYMNTLFKDDIFDIYLLDQDKNIVIVCMTDL
ncbi:MAG: hypothetical protein PUC65_11785 [Clostridiales bacterium]|nr:hypothetical protein [Clostridiales bacterium]